MGLAFSELTIQTAAGPRNALVITPTAHIRVSPDRLVSLRESTEPGPIDMAICDQAWERAPGLHLTIFRGRDDGGEGSWAFAEGMDPETRGELTYLMLIHQMHVYRELIRAGLCLHLHVEWGEEEIWAFRAAARRRVEELERVLAEGPESAKLPAQVDIWILRNLTFFFQLDLDTITKRLLPDKLALLERRMSRVHQMVVGLQAEAAS